MMLMSIERIVIPTHVRDEFARSQHLVLHALGSWLAPAASTYELVQANVRRLETTVDDSEKAFLGWEVVAAAVELAELVATLILHTRHPLTSLFHSADNQTLKALFASLAADDFSQSEGFRFLRLRSLRGFSRETIRTMAATGRVVENLRIAVNGISNFWLIHADNARWFRHLPMSLTVDEADEISSGEHPSHETVTREIEATANRVETLARMDESTRVLEYTALRMEDIRAARQVAATANELVMNWISNNPVDGRPRPNERWLFQFLTHRLTDAEKRALEQHGHYILAERPANTG
ncbi:MAG TPA: hypothetical protein VGJ81_18150 [Thermoanaerobaculia bacterium]|jgi:hypothetical protein